jgi:hydroxymethylglutaryl-CoA synthase
MDHQVGISGFGIYVPPYRVNLESWCQWTGNSWDKTQAVVGRSFRMRGPAQSVYTIAASAVLRLIENYSIDPSRIGFLGLGTESSTDNSAGAVIVKGMLDDALRAKGLPTVGRNCEVPEIKHACLGGIYALKHGLRYLALEEDEDKVAIVVSADIAEYARGSSGEPTQGAGAVAILIERNPKLLAIDIRKIGSASSYRAVDFRKPVLRNIIRGKLNCHFQDLPVFNGKYSTTCYIDETLHALDDMTRRLGTTAARYYHSLGAAFMHRPYHRMPETSFAMSYLFALGRAGAEGRERLAVHCEKSALDIEAVLAEMESAPDVLELFKSGNIEADAYPLTIELSREFRKSSEFTELMDTKMSLGSDAMKDIGNVYCAALPAWIAAGLEEAVRSNVDFEGANVLAVGYGSGDAAEAIPMRVVPGWRDAAAKIGFELALRGYQDLTQQQYESLHDTGDAPGLGKPQHGFVVEAVGTSSTAQFSDEGIEYYSFVQ